MKWSFHRTVLIAVLVAAVMACLCACGDKKAAKEEETSYELALITDEVGIDDGSFHQMVWEAIQSFADENDMTCQYYEAENDEEAYLKAIRTARKMGAKLVVLAGGQFETIAYKAQKEYSDLYFVLLDGVPRDKDFNYNTAANSIGVLFAEQEAGYLAGYAAVCEGYTKIGFMGGDALPAVKRYGYGFVQGVNAAAKEKKVADIRMIYSYMGTFEASDEIESEAFGWYESGTEVIFACGGSIGESVMAAAESADGKVIGVDADQSSLSDTVITSALKEAGSAITHILKNYKRNNFESGAILTYSAENDGIGLEMTNSRMTVFDQTAYNQLYREIKSGQRDVISEIENTEVQQLVEDPVKIEVIEE